MHGHINVKYNWTYMGVFHFKYKFIFDPTMDLTRVILPWRALYSMRNTRICWPFCTSILVNQRQLCGEASFQIIKRFPASYRIQQLYCHIHRTNPLAIILFKRNPLRSHISHSFKPHFNIILPCMPRPSNWSLPYRFYAETKYIVN